MRAVAWPIVALGGGLLWALCFGKQAFAVAPWLGLAPLLPLLGVRRAWLLGWLHGVAYWLLAVHWVRPTLETYGGLPSWLAAISLLLLCLYLGAYHGAFAALGRGLWRRGGPVMLAGLPAVWVALEWLRAHLISGFPWNLAAYAWTGVPGALPSAAWIGAYGVSFLVVSANVAVATILCKRQWRLASAILLICLVVLAVGARWGAGEGAGARTPGQEVRLLQPNSENLTAWDPVRVGQNYGRIFELSRRACDRPGALLVWPESAAWPYAWDRDPGYRRDLERLAAAGCPVLFNTTETRPAGFFNSVMLLGRQGPAGNYDKRHLVPFGEYVPLARVFVFLKRIARSAGDYQPGREPTLLPWGRELLGPAICFEVIFPAEVAEMVRAGATVLLTVTNDAWYGDTSAPWQHFRAARFRAAEMRRPLVRAAITGVSAVVEPDGQIRQMLGVYEQGILRDRIAGRRDLSPYARRPHLVPAVCSLLAVLAIALCWRPTGERPGQPATGQNRSDRADPASP